MDKVRISEYVSIGELVRLTGCRYSTLKFYTEQNLLPDEQEDEHLTRRFPRESAVKRIGEIQMLRNQNKSIPEIKQWYQGGQTI
jgi:DNA-binding transcriptional MerR regulator